MEHPTTLNLEQAAKFLHMSPSALRAKIKKGEIKAAKLSKKWVFIQEDLVDYIRSHYHVTVEIPSSGSIHREVKLCHYTDGKKHGGLGLQHQTDEEYAVLLGLRTKP